MNDTVLIAPADVIAEQISTSLADAVHNVHAERRRVDHILDAGDIPALGHLAQYTARMKAYRSVAQAEGQNGGDWVLALRAVRRAVLREMCYSGDLHGSLHSQANREAEHRGLGQFVTETAYLVGEA